ncbi:MAG: SUF system NifU family Fe-S cluster assembly protein [Chloroflexi bacterium]|nr:SUF system NifU family Fe-S cluster assembly protein [Chloroflexota bacterium]
MDDLYRDYILEHYRRPHNFGVLEHANASHEGANPLCGDRITLQLRLIDGRIAGVGFTGRGCAISQASASLLTDEIKGKSVTDAAAMKAQEVLDLMGIAISPARLKCALLSLETMQLAIAEAGVPAGQAPTGWAPPGVKAGETIPAAARPAESEPA